MIKKFDPIKPRQMYQPLYQAPFYKTPADIAVEQALLVLSAPFMIFAEVLRYILCMGLECILLGYQVLATTPIEKSVATLAAFTYFIGFFLPQHIQALILSGAFCIFLTIVVFVMTYAGTICFRGILECAPTRDSK